MVAAAQEEDAAPTQLEDPRAEGGGNEGAARTARGQCPGRDLDTCAWAWRHITSAKDRTEEPALAEATLQGKDEEGMNQEGAQRLKDIHFKKG
jgi:hypothetical protein